MLFQLNPSSSMIINRARLTSAAGETRDRVNDTNARRSSLVRLKTDCMLHIVLLKSMLHNTRIGRNRFIGRTAVPDSRRGQHDESKRSQRFRWMFERTV